MCRAAVWGGRSRAEPTILAAHPAPALLQKRFTRMVEQRATLADKTELLQVPLPAPFCWHAKTRQAQSFPVGHLCPGKGCDSWHCTAGRASMQEQEEP